MKKTLIAAALLAAFANAQAFQSEGATTGGGTASGGVLDVGPTTFPDGHFHGPNGAPGVGFLNPSPGYIISLQSIDSFSYKGTVTPAGGAAFRRYQLLNYTHTGPGGGGTISTDFNWFKIPTISQQVYFGIATNPGTTTHTHDAFYVGDRTGHVVPTATTNYATVAVLAVPGTSSTALYNNLTGNLRYDVTAGTLKTATTTGVVSTLSGSGQTLAINANVNAAAGTFSGTSQHNGGTSVGSSVNGKFFGSGTTSAVAGIAKGGSGSGAYVASFGGIKQ
ncbi:MAG: hypothetical protein QM777_23085 [Pseudorhodoferax sp.]